MKIFAISDLHVSTFDKPMGIFGDHWINHFEKIKSDWLSKVTNEDIVILAGDICWAMNMEEAKSDYSLFMDLPGIKIICKGNHEYYWNSLSKMQNTFPDLYFIQNNAYKINGYIFCGTRGWDIPNKDSTPEDIKIYHREIERLKLSLNQAKKLQTNNEKIIFLTHFPPYAYPNANSEFTKLFEEFNVKAVVFGHLHGMSIKFPTYQIHNDIEYYLTSADQIDFKLVEINL